MVYDNIGPSVCMGDHKVTAAFPPSAPSCAPRSRVPDDGVFVPPIDFLFVSLQQLFEMNQSPEWMISFCIGDSRDRDCVLTKHIRRVSASSRTRSAACHRGDALLEAPASQRVGGIGGKIRISRRNHPSLLRVDDFGNAGFSRPMSFVR